jgi:hypothetical protein
MALIGDEADGDDRREHPDDDRGAAVLDRGWRDHAPRRLGQQQQRAADQKGRLGERRQRPGLAVTKAVLAVGRAHRVLDRDEVDDRRGGVDERIDEARQQRDGPAAEPGGDLDRDQDERGRERGIGGARPQPARAFGLDRRDGHG